MKILEENEIEEISKILLEGKIIALPTETVYGLFTLATKKEYFDNLVKVKNRNPNKPFTLMISNLDQVSNIFDINENIKKFINIYSPGPITYILKCKDNAPDYLSLNTGYIGLRIPNDKTLLSVLNKINKPLLAPSANPSDMKPALDYQEVINYFDGKIEAVVKGKCISNVPSTVIKIENDDIILLREGELKFADIKEKFYDCCVRK